MERQKRCYSTHSVLFRCAVLIALLFLFVVFIILFVLAFVYTCIVAYTRQV